jgi:hypothetical protein
MSLSIIPAWRSLLLSLSFALIGFSSSQEILAAECTPTGEFLCATPRCVTQPKFMILAEAERPNPVPPAWQDLCPPPSEPSLRQGSNPDPRYVGGCGRPGTRVQG